MPENEVTKKLDELYADLRKKRDWAMNCSFLLLVSWILWGFGILFDSRPMDFAGFIITLITFPMNMMADQRYRVAKGVIDGFGLGMNAAYADAMEVVENACQAKNNV